MKADKFAIFVFIITSFSIGGVFFIFNNNYFIEENNEIKLTSSISDSEFINKESKNELEEIESNESYKSSSFPVPEIVRAVYITSWSASKESHIDYVIDLAKKTDINTVVIDVKDFSGYVAYDIDLDEVKKYGAKQVRIKNINSLIDRFHNENIYVIARVTVFQDPVLAKARNDLAVLSQESINNSADSLLWKDNLGLAWIDPAGKESWDYNIAIAKDALRQGFDEINFDYVRFPSDGNLRDMVFPFWKGENKRHEVMEEFFAYLRKEMPEAVLSVDLFGLSTVSHNDLGIGQIIEDSYNHFDYICPMIYPSHYSSGFLGYENPAEYPYEVVKKSISDALNRLKEHDRADEIKLRPWLQDFSLKTKYDAEMVKAQIMALKDVMGDDYVGYMLWSPYNFYTEEALKFHSLEENS